MYDFTIHQKMLLHLSKFGYLDIGMEYGAPEDITQDGTAAALGITRSHACTVLIRMKKMGEVKEGLARVKGSRSRVKRKIYLLTESGQKILDKLLDELEASGIPRSELVLRQSIDRMSAESMCMMTPEDRRTMGMLCVLRRKLSRQETGVDGAGFPFDSKGCLSINPESKERFLGTAKEGEMEQWHSAAADLYSGDWEDLPERLRHLTLSGRNREALRLAYEHRFEIADSKSGDILDSMLILIRSTGDCELSLYAALLAVRLGDAALAWEALKTADTSDRSEAMRAETLLAEGKTEEALAKALNCYSTDCDTPLTLGKCMNSVGRHAEALVYLRIARRRMMDAGCLFRLGETSEEEAIANRALGRPERAGALEMSAEASKPDVRFRISCWP